VRVVYYTHPAFFETALHLTRELSRLVELHVLIEVSPWTWRLAGFDVPPLDLQPGVVPAESILQRHLPPEVSAFLAEAAGVHFVVHRDRRSLGPGSWIVTQRVLRFLRRLEPDVLHVDGADQSLRLAIGVPWRLDVPMAVSVHDPQSHSGESDWHIPLTRSLLFRRTDRFVLYNNASLAQFRTRYGIPAAQVTAMPLGIIRLHGEKAKHGDSDAGPVVLFFGRISPYKGLGVLYDAAPLVASEVPGVRFVIAGRPIDGYKLPPPPLLPCGGTIDVFADYIGNQRAQALFQSARVVACPYLDATQSAVILTSYGFGKPVVATRVGGLPEYVRDGETGLLVGPGDARGLAAALIRILQDEHLRHSMRTGISVLERGPLAWRKSAASLVDLYREMIGSVPPA
jgi:glycosyltransferase involved in cell wall biosynthesis